MTPSAAIDYLRKLIGNVSLSVMIWGPTGVGKSSIVAQVAEAQGIELTDLRLSQIAPTDLCGIPVPRKHTFTRMLPDFLPTGGRGILLLDDFNVAPTPTMSVAQQLLVDRRVGSYIVPAGWVVWAAGYRKEHRAAIFPLPPGLSNRILHVSVEPSASDFRQYSIRKGLSDELIAFLAYREDLLYRMSEDRNAWPTPRSWEIADSLDKAGMDCAAAVGAEAADEFKTFRESIAHKPGILRILGGISDAHFPEETRLRFATVMSLAARTQTHDHAVSSLRWLTSNAPPEWVQCFARTVFPQLRQRNLLCAVHRAMVEDPILREHLENFARLLAG